jgi:hypothetical protein
LRIAENEDAGAARQRRQNNSLRYRGISRQSLVNIEGKGVNEVKSREITLAKILRALGERGAMLIPNGVARAVPESQSPNVKSISSGPADVQRVDPATANQVFMR